MDQGSSSVTHDSSPNNNDNSEDDDWQKIGDDEYMAKIQGYEEQIMKMSPDEMRQFFTEKTRKAGESSAYPPPPNLTSNPPSGPSHDPVHHTPCASCASNGGPSSYQQPLPAATNGLNLNSSAWNPLYPPAFNPAYLPLTPVPPPPLPYNTPQSILDALSPHQFWPAEMNRMLQLQEQLLSNAPQAADANALIQNAEKLARSATGTTGTDKVNEEFVNAFLKTLLNPPEQHASSMNGSMQPPPHSSASSLSAPPPIPPSLLQPQPLVLHALSQAHEYAMFQDLERRVIDAYKRRYCQTVSQPSIPYLISTSTNIERTDPLWTACQYDRWASRGRAINGVTASSSQHPFNPVTPTPEQNKIISEAIIYVQARWPLGCQEGVCIPLQANDMPPSVSYDHFTQLLPNFLTRFGEPLASFLTILSCFIEDEKKRNNLEQTNLMLNGRHVMRGDNPPPNWEKILRGDPPDNPLHFTPEMDEKMLAVLREALQSIVVVNQNGLIEEQEEEPPTMDEISEVSRAVTAQLLQATGQVWTAGEIPLKESLSPDAKALIDAFYEKHIVQGHSIVPPPPSFEPSFLASLALAQSVLPTLPTSLPAPEPVASSATNDQLLSMTDEEFRELYMKDVPQGDLSEELEELVRAMERAGARPPDYHSTQDLINKLIFYQTHYGVNAVPHLSAPALMPLNPQSGLPMTMEEINRSMLTPPELMPLFPNSKKFRYNPCNAMITDFRRKKRIEKLALSDDEESDEAGGLHSLPVSIKREYVLGVGSFGTVYEGCVVPLEKATPRDTVDMESDDKKVAIKAINMSYFPTYPYLKKQLDYEVNTLRQCMGFPAIVQFEGFTESPFNTVSSSQHAFIVMELMGCNLDDYVKKQESHRLSELHAKVIIRQIQAALNYLHCRAISHCDLKPSNILLNDKSSTLPNIKLCDFGHVRFYGDNINETEIAEQTGGLGVANNRGYRAPEHATAEGFSPELDMYALGAVSYYIMTGFIPNISAPRNPVVVTRTKKGKKGKKIEETVEIPRLPPSPSVSSLVPGCVLHPSDDRMKENEQIFDLPEEQHLWPYTGRLSYHFCKEHMRIDPNTRITLRDSMDHEWLSGFEMYSMLRRLECKMGLFKPSERHLTTVLDDVNYQRGMLYMASNPSYAQQLSAADPSSGSAALLNLYAREGDYSYLYGPVIRDPPLNAPLSIEPPTAPVAPPPSITPSSSPIPMPHRVPIVPFAGAKKPSGKPKKKAK